MFKTVLLSLIALSVGLPVPSVADPNADILQLEQDFNAAYAANDVDKA